MDRQEDKSCHAYSLRAGRMILGPASLPFPRVQLRKQLLSLGDAQPLNRQDHIQSARADWDTGCLMYFNRLTLMITSYKDGRGGGCVEDEEMMRWRVGTVEAHVLSWYVGGLTYPWEKYQCRASRLCLSATVEYDDMTHLYSALIFLAISDGYPCVCASTSGVNRRRSGSGVKWNLWCCAFPPASEHVQEYRCQLFSHLM